jgi:hypothetical protein
MPGIGAEGTTLTLAPLFIIEFDQLQLGGPKGRGVERWRAHLLELALLGVLVTPIPRQ